MLNLDVNELEYRTESHLVLTSCLFITTCHSFHTRLLQWMYQQLHDYYKIKINKNVTVCVKVCGKTNCPTWMKTFR